MSVQVWKFFTTIQTDALKNDAAPFVKSVALEVAKLNQQQCPSCSGFGHAAKDCPTTVKLS